MWQPAHSPFEDSPGWNIQFKPKCFISWSVNDTIGCPVNTSIQADWNRLKRGPYASFNLSGLLQWWPALPLHDYRSPSGTALLNGALEVKPAANNILTIMENLTCKSGAIGKRQHLITAILLAQKCDQRGRKPCCDTCWNFLFVYVYWLLYFILYIFSTTKK